VEAATGVVATEFAFSVKDVEGVYERAAVAVH